MERAEKAAKDHGIPGHYINFEEMLDKEKPDLVSIVTPPEFHCPMAMAALDRRIHVLCEKPFALNLEEAKRMQAAAEKAGAVAMVDYEFRFLAGRAYAAELLRENYVGEIRMGHFIVQGSHSKPEDAAWDWWSDASRGGGALGAIGSHAIDALWVMMGPVRRVFCDLVSFVPQRGGVPVTSDDSFTLILEVASGARAVIQMTTVAGIHDAHFGIYGNRGQLTIRDLFATKLYGAKKPDWNPQQLEIPKEYQLIPEETFLRAPFRALVHRMIHAIDNRLPSPSPDFSDGVNSQAVLDAARLSASEQRWVEVAKCMRLE